MVIHKAKQPKKYAGTARHVRYIDCTCGWEGRLTTLEKAKAEFENHANGILMRWEIDAAHYDAILEDRARARIK